MNRLFDVQSQIREIRAIKAVFDTLNYWALCNDTFSWFAVNIPMNILGDDVQGDLDIIVKIPDLPFVNKKGFYRNFEVKVCKVDLQNNIKSLKLNKTPKILKQVNKLIKLGCENVFVLEIYILETGYSNQNYFYNKDILKAISEKLKIYQDTDFGYLVMPIEFLPNVDENIGGQLHIPNNIKLANPGSLNEPFKSIAKHLDNFYMNNKSSVSGGVKIICYCKKCKELKLIIYKPGYVYECDGCKLDLFI